MSNRIAVAVIHGMGSQGNRPQDLNSISFSAGLYRRLREYMGDSEWLGNVAWREIFWSDILQDRQSAYITNALAGQARWMKTRRFVMHNLTDAAAYRKVSETDADVYDRIHERVRAAIANLETVAGSRTPLIVLAHSLGGHIMSNYIYDLQKAIAQGDASVSSLSSFQRMDTMAGIVTFGCNIPIFTFAYPPQNIRPIDRPGALIPTDKRLDPWWLNFNDKDDALGMPLGPTSPAYGQLAASGQLDDRWIDVGGLIEFWNPASHNGYWTDRHFYRPVAAFLRKALRIGPVGP